MSSIEAIYRHGVFEPLGPVDLKEDQRVRLTVDTAIEESPEDWLDQIKAMQQAILRRSGCLPDSAADISADRLQ
jgi:predicted DNA-binding antitoxin AbrB/MazE fold protein